MDDLSAHEQLCLRMPDNQPASSHAGMRKPMTFENGCELLRWLDEAEAFALAAVKERN